MKNPFQSLGRKVQAFWDNLYFDNGFLALLQRLPPRPENLVIYRKKNVTFLVDFAGGDAPGTRSCLSSDMYSRFFTQFNSARPLKVLDLGANGGGFPLSLRVAGFTFAKLVCVEMNPSTCVRLRFNLGYNLPSGFVAINAAAAGHVGTIKIPITQGGTNESIDQPSVTSGDSVEIPLTTFDEIVHTHFGSIEEGPIDICKMDVERAEYAILQSSTCETLRRVRHLIIEIHPHPTFRVAELITRICSFGFRHVHGNPEETCGVHFSMNENSTP